MRLTITVDAEDGSRTAALCEGLFRSAADRMSEALEAAGSEAAPCLRLEDPSRRVLFDGDVDGLRTRIVQPDPGHTYVEALSDWRTRMTNDDLWAACGDEHALRAYEVAFLLSQGCRTE